MAHPRRLRRRPAALEITAFLNLIVVLVPFLLSTAVFTRIAVLEMNLPAAQTSPAQARAADTLQLEVVIRADAIEVGDRVGGLIERIARADTGHDLRRLAAVIAGVKARHPQQSDATVLAEAETPYDTLVQVMDTLRAAPDGERMAWFPQLAIGDAPPILAGRRP